MKSAEIRTQFLEFFRQRGHDVVASSSLVPGNDPTLLFTNAGMVQFKDVFLGLEQRPYKRAVSSQRCVRAGGKHNDLDNVGYTARHHTFFEMLGNFSFGDYFKREAIQYAWEFLTKTLKLPPERLWITVYDKDDETADIWLKEQKVDPTRFSRIGEKDNFWSMGDTGPCGPCSEIFYDHGPQVAGGPPGSPDADGDRYVEIWNLVFMQFNRAQDGTLTPLPKPSVDTGMGLERLAAVMQGVHSNYEIDSFKKLIAVIADLAKTRDFHNPSLRVIADHIRSTAFLVVDGVLPSNEGRGYVVRRIMRRAIRHGYMLGMKESFFYKLVKPLAEEMGEAYPELLRKQDQIERVLRLEEERFAETLEQGLRILEQDLARLSSSVIPGDVLFKLYDTYGFPADLTADIARERGLTVDMIGFEKEMEQQRERARAASQFGVAYATPTVGGAATCFTGYAKLNDAGTVVALYRDGKPVASAIAGDDVSVVLDNTPFYGESGGQVGDQGLLEWSGGELRVTDAQKQGDVIIHSGKVARGELKIGDRATASVNAALRKATALNHSATHLLHAALRQLLGEHVQQKGSLVGPNRLRFDFSHFEGVTKEQLRTIEATVNEQVRHNAAIETQLMKFDDAQKTGAMALFGEKYGDTVRVLRIGEFSTELCGGTHASRAGDIGFFKITSEAGVAAGVRRIEAITGESAVSFVEDAEGRLQRVAEMLKASANDVEEKLDQLLQKLRKLEKESDQLKGKIASSQGSDLAASAVDVGGIKVLAARLDGVDSKSLRDIVDQLKNKLGSAAVVVATVSDGKVSLVAGVTADNTTRVKAGELINHVALQVGGKGGGRPDMAQAGGTNPEALSAALASVVPWVREKLS